MKIKEGQRRQTITTWPPKDAIASELGRRLRLTARRLTGVVTRHRLPPPLLDGLWRVLRDKGKLLDSRAAIGHSVTFEDHKLWSLLVVLAHGAASGTDYVEAPMAAWRAVAPVAAAAEILGAACDLADDIEDGDSELVKELGIPCAVQISITLFGLVHAAIADPQTPELLRGSLHAIETDGLLISCGGQYLDLVTEQHDQISIEEAMSISERKSGALIALTMQLGALVGLSAHPERLAHTEEILGLFSELGRALGMMAQLENDLDDALTVSTKSDRERGKKTPFLVMEAELERGQPSADVDVGEMAMQFLQVTAMVQRARARQALDRLAALGIGDAWLGWLTTGLEE